MRVRLSSKKSELFYKLSDVCLDRNSVLVGKIRCILNNPTVTAWVDQLPIIPNLMLDLLTFERIHEMVTENFMWQYFSISLVEDQNDAPDITPISHLCDIENDFDRYQDMLPIDSLDELERTMKWRSGSFE
jgi:hypothetical protein